MKKINLLVLILVACAFASCGTGSEKKAKSDKKVALMWFDASANFERFSSTDSIDFYLEKIKGLGFTHAIVDVLPITGEVLYDSEFAPRQRIGRNGFERADFDYLGHFIAKAHQLGMEVHASMNVFCAGHNFHDKGLIYEGHPEWASMVYTHYNKIIPITEEKYKYSAMVNPIDPTFQKHITNIMKELVTKYPALDGLMLDRVRYEGIIADFSDMSKKGFEAYIGEEVVNFPKDIFEWGQNEKGEYVRTSGKHYKKWIEWRTKNIYDFMKFARNEVKTANPNASFGTYTGAWYPSYFEVGVNFASNTYDVSKDYDWATADYKNYGYAELMDLYTTGNYYTDVSIEDSHKNQTSVKNETDSEASSGTWYSVEGSNKNLRKIMGDNQFSGGILADQFYENPDGLRRSIEMNLATSDGVMIFDIIHIINKNMWAEVEAGMRNSGMIMSIK